MILFVESLHLLDICCFESACKDGPTKDSTQEAGPGEQLDDTEPNNTSVSPFHSGPGGTSQEATQEEDSRRTASLDAPAEGQRHVQQMFEKTNLMRAIWD